MKKALFLLEDINQTGSPQTALHFIEALESRFEVDVLILCVQDKNIDLARLNEFKKHTKTIEVMNLPHMVTKKYKLLYPIYKKKIMNKVDILFNNSQYDLIYSNRLSVSGWVFPAIKNKYPNTKTIFNALGNLRDRTESKYPFLRKRDDNLIENTIKYTDYYISISNSGILKGLENNNNVHILRDFPNIELKNDKKEFSPIKTIRLGQIGYYCSNKNQLFSLQILKRLIEDGYNASITFIGFKIEETGDYFDQMTSFINKNSLSDKVTFLDSHSDKIPFFDSIDILLCPSHTEGLPLVLLESQYRKTPCIASLAVPEEANLGALKIISLNEFDKWIKYLETESFKNNSEECQDLKTTFFETINSIIN